MTQAKTHKLGTTKWLKRHNSNYCNIIFSYGLQVSLWRKKKKRNVIVEFHFFLAQFQQEALSFKSTELQFSELVKLAGKII